uniref:MARVEL domain-containing protein n=1 Tax=Rhodosorus marinus TaxID=101924 RepID=A0A7S3A557_9RHOD|mmetsp:Transcript_44105/g.172050  ORF Transcript_44105/g.172050 Transcript_44105/m.172050 type:complete len:146 (+) Transcript_44105:191-628(+)
MVTPLTISRTALLGIEWIFSICIFAIAADENFRSSIVSFAIAWGVLAFIPLTLLLIWSIMDYFTNYHFPAMYEFYAQCVLVVIFWFIGGISVSAVRPAFESNWNAVIAFFWVNFVLGIISAAMSFWDAKNDDGGEAGEPKAEAEI